MFVFVVMSGLAQGADLPTVFSQAADEYGVPEKLLLALSYEASHWRPDVVSAWSGYGLFDFQEELGGPNIEAASIVSGIDPDDIIRDPVATRAAAWLAISSVVESWPVAEHRPTNALVGWGARLFGLPQPDSAGSVRWLYLRVDLSALKPMKNPTAN